MNPVYTFDLPVDDMERAKKFYEAIFGWKIAPVPGSGEGLPFCHYCGK